MLWLYQFTSPIMALIVVAATWLLAVLGHWLFRCCLPLHLDAEQRAAAISMLSVIATINSLLIAFASVSVWDSYRQASDTVTAEAVCIGELARDLNAMEDPQADLAGVALHRYLDRIVAVEWPSMQRAAQADRQAEKLFDAAFVASSRIRPAYAWQNVLFAEVLGRLNELVRYREQRIASLRDAMPSAMWGVILTVSAFSLLLLYVMPATPFQLTLVSLWATTLGLAFFFLLMVDRPFAGRVSVSAEPLRQVLAELRANGVWGPPQH